MTFLTHRIWTIIKKEVWTYALVYLEYPARRYLTRFFTSIIIDTGLTSIVTRFAFFVRIVIKVPINTSTISRAIGESVFINRTTKTSCVICTSLTTVVTWLTHLRRIFKVFIHTYTQICYWAFYSEIRCLTSFTAFSSNTSFTGVITIQTSLSDIVVVEFGKTLTLAIHLA